MKADELRAGKHFRISGVDLWCEVVRRAHGALLVRFLEGESRTFTAHGGDEVTISFRPRAFWIDGATAVEVE